MRKHYSAEFKAKIVLEMLKEDKSMAQIASEQGIHPNQLSKWKAQALEGFPELFGTGRWTSRKRTSANGNGCTRRLAG